MKNLAALFYTTAFSLFLMPVVFPASAQDICPPGYESLCAIEAGNVSNLIHLLIIIAIILSVVFLIWGGIKWITSGGDKAKLDQARTAITASIVGLIVSLLAYFITSIVVMIFTGQNDLSLPIPKLV